MVTGLAQFGFCAWIGTGSFVENIDPNDDDSQYAWAENVGWLNADLDTNVDGTPDEGITVSDFALSGWLSTRVRGSTTVDH